MARETSTRRRIGAAIVVLAVAAAIALTLVLREREDRRVDGGGRGTGVRSALELRPEGILLSARDVATAIDARMRSIGEALRASRATGELAEIVVDYPHDGSVFPPDFTAPTFLWHDTAKQGSAWLVEVAFSDGDAPILTLVPGARPPRGEIDPETLGPTNEVYRPTPYQASARSWTPPDAVWEEIKRRSRAAPATITLRGFDAEAPTEALSTSAIQLTTAKDPVGAPIFYRDVPLMPALGAKGIISPLATNVVPLIAWRLRDVGRPDSKVLLEGMPSCANCHSFSADGETFGMDVDGPQGDKGAYAIVPVSKDMVIDYEHVITWNSFPDKPEGHKTIGFLSRVSPDGKYVLSTVNEALYVSNFADYRFLQVFYPTRGILACYSTETGEMKALPGADDPAYVHCGPAWTPDGQTIVFSRAEAFDPYEEGKPLAEEPNDPNEPRIRYSLYRVPFEEGRGGAPAPIEGASHNGMSNTFPKVSPDGKWIVFTKCRNGQLMRPDGKLWIVPVEGGRARPMRCNTELMNSWHSFTPNGRWLVFSSKANTPYTQMFLTHIDEDGNDTPAILIPNSTAPNRAVNLPEFVNVPYDAFERIEVPAVNHIRQLQEGTHRLEAHDVDGALPFLEKAVELEPEFGLAHANLGNALSLKGELERAEKHLRRSLELHPESTFAWNSLGYVRGRRGHWSEALEHFRRAVDISPRSPYAYNNVGIAMRELGRPALAADAFRRAIELDPGFADAHKNLGFALLQAGNPAEASRHYRQALAIDPKDPTALSSLANALLRTGETEEAIRLLGRLVEVAPEDARAHLSLAWHLATHPSREIRDGERAISLAQRAFELGPERLPLAYDVLGAAFAEAGRYPEAVEAAEKAKRLAEDGGGPLPSGIEERLARYRAGKSFHQSPRGP